MGDDLASYRARIGCYRGNHGTDVTRVTVTLSVTIASKIAGLIVFLAICALSTIFCIASVVQEREVSIVENAKLTMGVLCALFLFNRKSSCIETLAGAVSFIHLLLLAAGVEPNPGPQLAVKTQQREFPALDETTRSSLSDIWLSLIMQLGVTNFLVAPFLSGINGQASVEQTGKRFNISTLCLSFYDNVLKAVKFSNTCCYLLGNKGVHMTNGNPHDHGADVLTSQTIAWIESGVHESIGYISIDRCHDYFDEFNSHGTGFRVGDRHFMTAYHIVRDKIDDLLDTISMCTPECTSELLKKLDIDQQQEDRTKAVVIRQFVHKNAVDIPLLLSRLDSSVKEKISELMTVTWKRNCVVDFVHHGRFTVDWNIPFGFPERDVVILTLLKSEDTQNMPKPLFLEEQCEELNHCHLVRYIAEEGNPRIELDTRCKIYEDDETLAREIDDAIYWWSYTLLRDGDKVYALRRSYAECSKAQDKDTGLIILKAAASFYEGSTGSPLVYLKSGQPYAGLVYQGGCPRLYYKEKEMFDAKMSMPIDTKVLFERSTTIEQVAAVLTRYDKENLKKNIFNIPKNTGFIQDVDGGMEPRYDCRIIAVGHLMAGKTTVIARLLLQHLDMSKTQRTNGIIVIRNGLVLLDSGEWMSTDTSQDLNRIFSRMKLAKSDQYSEEGYEETITENAITIYKKVQTIGNVELDGNTKDKNNAGDQSIVKRKCVAESKNEKEQSEFDIENDKLPTNTDKPRKSSEQEAVQQDSRKCNLSFMDFAGQSVFNSTHQMFMTHRAIYLLVLDVSRDLDSEVEDDDVYCIGANRRMTVQGLTEYLMSSIHVYSGGQNNLFPKVLLVGTHKDQVDEVTANQRMKQIKTSFKGTPLERHMLGDFLLDCTLEDEKELDRLRSSIFEIVSKEPYWGEKTPTRWLSLEMNIMEKREKERVLSLQTIRKMNEETIVPLKSQDEIEKFLCFHNALGNLIYFGGTSPDDIVILDPQWLVDAFKMLITHEQFYTIPKFMDNPWRDFTECAKLEKQLIKAVWSNNEDKTFITHEQQLLAIFEQTDIIASPLSYSTEGEAEIVDYYFVPSMLKPNQEGKEKIDALLRECNDKSPPLYFVFNDKFLPPAIFPRIQAACTSIYKIKQFQNKPLLFHQGAVFQLNTTTCVLIEHIKYTVKVTLITATKITPELCESVRLTLEDTLTKIVQLYGGGNVPFHKFVQCPFAGAENIDKLLNWNDLIEFGSKQCTDHTPEKCHTITNADALRAWKADKSNKRESQRLTKEENLLRKAGNLLESLGPKELSRMARRLPFEDLILAARRTVSEVSWQQSRADNKDDIAGEVLDTLMKWSDKVGGLTLTKVDIDLKDSNSEISINQIRKAIADTDAPKIVRDMDDEFLEKEVNDEAIDLISQRSAKMYKHLALELGSDLSSINTVVRDVVGVTNRIRQLLKEWRRTSVSTNYRQIASALVETEMDVNILTDCQALMIGVMEKNTHMDVNSQSDSQTLVKDVLSMDVNSQPEIQTLAKHNVLLDVSSELDSQTVVIDNVSLDDNSQSDSQTLVKDNVSLDVNSQSDSQTLVKDNVSLDVNSQSDSQTLVKDNVSLDVNSQSDSQTLVKDNVSLDVNSQSDSQTLVKDNVSLDVNSQSDSQTLVKDNVSLDVNSQSDSQTLVKDNVSLDVNSQSDSQILVKDNVSLDVSSELDSQPFVKDNTSMNVSIVSDSETFVKDSVLTDVNIPSECVALLQENVDATNLSYCQMEENIPKRRPPKLCNCKCHIL